MDKDLKELLLAFNAHGVDYLVVVDGEVPAHVISRKHLIQNKLATGRLQDLADVEAIRDANSDDD